MEMAISAIEVQKKWKPLTGDYYIEHSEIKLINEVPSDAHGIWLPTLEQLFDMLPEEVESPMIQVSVEVDSGIYKGKKYDDYKELLLDFLMRRVHKKTWLKDEWKQIK